MSTLSTLDALEAEAIYIFREVAAQFERPLLMYSIGKDSSAMLHLARKAFSPGRLPMPVLHIDTRWKFAEMIAVPPGRGAPPGAGLARAHQPRRRGAQHQPV
jgi:sulfate adenylyltransferase subunit 2